MEIFFGVQASFFSSFFFLFVSFGVQAFLMDDM